MKGMLTKKEFNALFLSQSLTETECAAAFANYVDQYDVRCTGDIWAESEDNKLDIWSAFEWERTKEGFNYWDATATRLATIRGEGLCK